VTAGGGPHQPNATNRFEIRPFGGLDAGAGLNCWAEFSVTSHSYSARNRRKIPKAVYLLLQQHHRTHGLAVVGWNKPPGNSYFQLLYSRSQSSAA
jgi:hypothetical protein